MTGFENLKMLAEIRHRVADDKIKTLMTKFSLEPNSKQTVKKYSLGMKQKIGIIQAIMENPDILILDEPFNALDEDTVLLVRNLLLQYRKDGKLIVITSHHREDIDAICNHIYRMEEGQLIAAN